MEKQVRPAFGDPGFNLGGETMPTNDRGPNARLSLGPERIVARDRPVIDTQSDLLRCQPCYVHLSQRGSPYRQLNVSIAVYLQLKRVSVGKKPL